MRGLESRRKKAPAAPPGIGYSVTCHICRVWERQPSAIYLRERNRRELYVVTRLICRLLSPGNSLHVITKLLKCEELCLFGEVRTDKRLH